MAADDVWQRFDRWRHRRPFWGALFLVLAGAELFFSANASLNGLKVHLGPSGFLSYLLPLILLVCGLLCIFSAAQRLFYGIVALAAALYSFIALNLGGFFIGMVLGIVGGALVISWGPPRQKPANPDFIPIGDGASPGVGPADAAPGTASGAGPSADTTQRIEIAGHDDRPHETGRAAVHDSGFVPGFNDQEHPKSGSLRSRLGKNPKSLTVALIVISLTAGVLAVGSRIQASASECPAGSPSASATATTSTTTAAAETAAAAPSASAPKVSSVKKSSTRTPTAPKTTTSSGSTTTTASPSPSASDPGSTLVDGVQGIIDGVGNLLGLGDSSPSPSESPSSSPTPTAEPTKTSDPEPTKTSDPSPTKTGDPDPTKSGDPSPSSPTKSAEPTTADTPSASPSSSADVVPCLGARLFGLQAGADGIPPVAAKPGLLQTASLTMYGATYDGVVNLPTASGTTVRALSFTMAQAVNKPFSLTVANPTGGQTVFTSDNLTTTGNVKFYTDHFEGKLIGLFPVTFTPDSPPPLMLPILTFTDVKIDLNYIRCNTLTGTPLHITGK